MGSHADDIKKGFSPYMCVEDKEEEDAKGHQISEQIPTADVDTPKGEALSGDLRL